MTVHNYRSRQVHETLNGVNPSSGFRDMRSAKSGPNLWQIWQVFGPWASPYGANGQMSITVHNYRPRQFHRTSNGENPSSGYRDMGSASLAAARPTARPPARPPARTVTTIPLQPGGLRGKKYMIKYIMQFHFILRIWTYSFHPLSACINYTECWPYLWWTIWSSLLGSLPKYFINLLIVYNLVLFNRTSTWTYNQSRPIILQNLDVLMISF